MWKQQKLLSNYLVVEIKGNSIERFLNMCQHHEIIFWNLTYKEKCVKAKITKNDFLKLRDPCRKTSTKVKVIKRRGFLFFISKYRKHYSFAIGITIAFIMLYFCSRYVWDISFEGNTEYTDSNLLKYLDNYDIKPGIPIKNIDCNKIESKLRNTYQDITWVSAEIRGTRLIIHIKENDGAVEEPIDFTNTRDIIAPYDGIVESIITRAGTPKVKNGDTVAKGQILVSGLVNVYDDSKEVCNQIITRADADILIMTDINYNDRIEKVYDKKEYTGRKKTVGCIEFCGYNASLNNTNTGFKEYDTIVEMKSWKLTSNFYLPISSGKYTYLEYKTVSSEYSEEEAEKILKDRLMAYLNQLIQNGVQIKDNSVKMETDGITYIYDGALIVLANKCEYAPVSYTPLDIQKDEDKDDN